MTRAAEFCYLVELRGPTSPYRFLMSAGPSLGVYWTPNAEGDLAIRHTEAGAKDWCARLLGTGNYKPNGVGFRKILVG